MKDWWKRNKVNDDLTLRVTALCLLYNWNSMFGSSNKNGLANMNKWGKFLEQNCGAALVGEYKSWFSINKVENVDWPP